MKILPTLLLISNLSLGQTIEIQQQENLSYKDVKGEYSIVWMGDDESIMGEHFRLSSRRKFEYEVFSIIINNGLSETKKVLVSGKYEMKSDTLTLTAIKNSLKGKIETFSLRENYIIKSFHLTIHFKEKTLTRRFTCFVPFDKLDIYNVNFNDLKKIASNIDTSEIYYFGIRELSIIEGEINTAFWNKRIFAKSEFLFE